MIRRPECICARPIASLTPYLLAHTIYLLTPDEQRIPYPTNLLPHPPKISQQLAKGRGSYDNPIPVDCEDTIVNLVIRDFQNILQEEISVPVETYTTQTLRSLADCALALGIDFLFEAYDEEYKRRQAQFKELFTELKSLFNDDHTIISLYLVIVGARKGFYLCSFMDEEKARKIQYIANKYGLYLTHSPGKRGGLLVTRERIDPDLLQNDLFLAYILDYGCLDPNWGNMDVPRITYWFHVSIEGEDYRIMSFVCTVPYRVSEERLQELTAQFQRGIDELDPTSIVKYRLKETFPPPLQ